VRGGRQSDREVLIEKGLARQIGPHRITVLTARGIVLREAMLDKAPEVADVLYPAALCNSPPKRSKPERARHAGDERGGTGSPDRV
jgi:hypothetical protein